MKSYKINSTTIRAIQYRKKKKRLIIEFMSGGVYEYKSVHHYMVKCFVKAFSIGRFFQDNIRSKYYYRKIDDNAYVKQATQSARAWKHPSEGFNTYHKD